MLAASGATLAILAAGQYLKVELYQIAIPGGTTYYFTAGDAPITVAGHTYLTGLNLIRGAITRTVGLDPQSLDLTVVPQADNPGGAVTIGGAGFLSACDLGLLDAAHISLYKGFFNFPAAGQQLDTSPGIVGPFFAGVIDEVDAGRFMADITIDSDIESLNVSMPRNLVQTGCVHSTYDAGCGLLRSAFTSTGAISGTITANSFHSALAQANGYFDLGVLTFTSGVLNGTSYTVAKHLNAGGFVQTIVPFAALPSAADTFSIVAGDDKTKTTCVNKFANGGRFRGYRFVPQPETLYDGGTSATTAPALGGQGGQGAGSPFGGKQGPGSYGP